MRACVCVCVCVCACMYTRQHTHPCTRAQQCHTTLRHMLSVVDLLVDIHSKVHHVGAHEQVQLALLHALFAVHILMRQELEQGEDQVAVQVAPHLGRQIIVGHGVDDGEERRARTRAVPSYYHM